MSTVKGTAGAVKKKTKIGSFGKINFTVSSKKILTFRNMRQNVSGEWTLHKPIGKKARSEFNGPGLRMISMDITLDASLGCKPWEELKKLEKMAEKGTVDYLVIGARQIGKNKFKLKSISESWDRVLEDGKLYQVSVSLELEEYR